MEGENDQRWYCTSMICVFFIPCNITFFTVMCYLQNNHLKTITAKTVRRIFNRKVAIGISFKTVVNFLVKIM